MIDLKITKEEKKKLQTEKSPADISDFPEYPWGTRLNFENDVVQKVPELQKLNAGDMVTFKAIAKVTRISVDDRAGKGGKSHSVEIQIQQIDVGGNPKDEKNAFESTED